jgi:hypothetical protein
MREVRIPTEVFLSHATPDRKVADFFASVLRANGIPVWYSRTNIVGAQQWHDEIGEALRRCDWFLVLVSRASVQSMWVKRELVFALNDSRYEERIIPVVLEKCDVAQLSWTLDGMQFVVQKRRDLPTTVRDVFRCWGQGAKFVTESKGQRRVERRGKKRP